jgi:hypothetical protein
MMQTKVPGKIFMLSMAAILSTTVAVDGEAASPRTSSVYSHGPKTERGIQTLGSTTLALQISIRRSPCHALSTVMNFLPSKSF